MDDHTFELMMKKFDDIDEKFKNVDSKLDTLLEFKWKIVGSTILASLILTVVINGIQIYFQN